MNRSRYSDDDDFNQLAMYRGQVASAIRGRRGQAFLRELIDALDTMPDKRLAVGELRENDRVCALGAVGAKRRMDLERLDPEDAETLAAAFGIAHQLIREIEWINDEGGDFWDDTPEERWRRVRDWAASNLRSPTFGRSKGER